MNITLFTGVFVFPFGRGGGCSVIDTPPGGELSC